MGIKNLLHRLTDIDPHLHRLEAAYGKRSRHWVLWIIFLLGTFLLSCTAEFIGRLF